MITVFITKFFIFWTATIPMTVNCDYLYFSSQGTELENAICHERYIELEQESINYKRYLLQERGIY